MSEHKVVDAEAVFRRMFSQERFYGLSSLPHFLQLFAPEGVQDLARTIMDRSQMQGSRLFDQVHPDQSPYADMPPLPQIFGEAGSVSGDREIAKLKSGEGFCPDAKTGMTAVEGERARAESDPVGDTCGDCGAGGSGAESDGACPGHDGGVCPFPERRRSGLCRCVYYAADGVCGCHGAGGTMPTQSRCVEAVMSDVTREVWDKACFDDILQVVAYALNKDSVMISLSELVRRANNRDMLFPERVDKAQRNLASYNSELAVYMRFCMTALCETQPELKPLEYNLICCAHNAAMVYDVGMAPFGATGEYTVRRECRKLCDMLKDRLSDDAALDLCAYNRHAQTMRMLHSVYKVNLTLSQMAVMVHEPFTVKMLKQMGMEEERACEHAGFYQTEHSLLRRLGESGILINRHPLSMLLESCNEMCRVFVILEDAWEREALKRMEALQLVGDLLEFLHNNACDSTCATCSSACTCANGQRILPEEFPEEPSDICNAERCESCSRRDTCPGNKNNSVKDHDAEEVSKCTDCDKNQICPRAFGKHKKSSGLSGEHDMSAGDLSRVRLDMVLSDAIKHSYCAAKQDSFGTLQLAHGVNPLSLQDMMQEFDTLALLRLVRECVCSYYLREVMQAVKADPESLLLRGVLRVTHYGNDAHKAVDFLSRYIESHIMYGHEIEEYALTGSAAISFLFGRYHEILKMDRKSFTECIEDGVGDPVSRMLLQRIKKEIRAAYLEGCRRNDTVELYIRARMVIDHISSMGEEELLHEYAVLSGSERVRL